MARMLLGMISVVFLMGCAQKDWIDRTLVTVDVTGTWYGRVASGGTASGSSELSFELEQKGSRVKGFVRVTAKGGPGTNIYSGGPIEGTVAGDVFRFIDMRDTNGELTVSGDEMNGRLSLLGSSQSLSLRRTDPSLPPGLPPR